MIKPIFISYLLVGISSTALANERIEGCFVAKTDCEALHSIRKHTNPGNTRLKPFELYTVIAKNKPKPSHYQIKISSGSNQKRWVPVACGNYVANCRLLPNIAISPSLPTSPSSPSSQHEKQYLLALSWEPTFCETHPQKIECKTLTPDRQDANQLSLHGLWPQPRNNAYCNVNSTDKAIDRRKKWGLLKPLELSEETRQQLAITMPGYASNLQRHEWIKHGTCYGTTADIYYQHSIQLTKAVNESAVGNLLENNIGKEITAQTIRAAFDTSFGEGAGSKVNVRCDRKGRLSELWINLNGRITDAVKLGNLMKQAPTANNSCNSGLVDRVD